MSSALLSLLDAFSLLRLEELRADLRRDLETAATWVVTAHSSGGMVVNIGPYQVAVPPSHPTFGTIDLAYVGLRHGQLHAGILHGCPNTTPAPPILEATFGVPLAWINKHAYTVSIRPWNITAIPKREAP